MTNQEHSWQYDPLVSFKVTINNQFALLMLCEQMLINNIFVVSLNTDGIVCLLKDYQLDKYKDICKQWEILTKHNLEYTHYDKFIQTSVNDYISRTTDGKIKQKGDFEIDKELHKNKSNTIKAIALKEYYINNKSIRDIINNHTDIFDFCIGKKKQSNQIYEYIWCDDLNIKSKEIDSKVIRYIISNNGGKLIKRYTNKNKGNKTKIDGDYKITLYMNHKKRDIREYNIDYSYYENEVLKLIHDIKIFKMDEYLSKFKTVKQLNLFI